MTAKRMASMLMLICPEILRLLSERRGIEYAEAEKLLYSSVLYERLEETETGLWHLSAETLYALLEEELTMGKITFPEEQ